MGGIKTQIDLEQLQKEVRSMSPRSKLYKILRNELSRIGHWKQLKRGKPNPRNI